MDKYTVACNKFFTDLISEYRYTIDSKDMYLPPLRDNDNGGRQPARRRRNRRHLPRMVGEQHSSSPCPLPCQRRRRRGNQGQAGGRTSLAVERIDVPSAPTEGTPGVDLAFETKAGAVPPRHADPEQEDDAGALADRKSTRLNSSHITRSRMPSSA